MLLLTLLGFVFLGISVLLFFKMTYLPDILFILSLAISFCCFYYPLLQKGCESKAAIMQVDSKFSVFAGCMIKKGEKYVPLENYRGLEDL